MSGNDAKNVLRGMIGIMALVNLQKPDTSFSMVLKDFAEAVDIACTAIDMTEDRLDIDNGGKK